MAERSITQVITPKRSSILSISEIWEYRELFYYFAWRDIKVRYKQTMLGVAWAILQPFVQIIVFTFVLALFRGGGLEGKPTMGLPQPVFLAVGIVLWNAFAQGLANSANSLNQNAAMLKKIFFPKIILPFASVVVVFFDMMMGFIVVSVVFIYYGIAPHPYFLIGLPVALGLTFFVTTGLGMLLSALSVKYRDFRYVIPFSIQLLFWLTPVMYPAVATEGTVFEWFILLNPMGGAIDIARLSLTGELPELTNLAATVGMTVFFFAVGILYFKRTEYYFADIS